MNKILTNNWIKNLLGPAMRENGCPSEIRTQEDVLNNLYYLSREDGRGSRYIPLQYKRMIEKIVFGLFNTAFEYADKQDVYFEKIGDTMVCCANVNLVSFAEDGTKRVLGHGFHCLSLDEVMPGVFMSDSERTAKWKSTVIGGAKSRALYDAGIGLEFYGDVFTPEENLDENELPKEVKAAPKASEKKEEKKYSASGMPIPKAKKVAKDSEPEKNELAMKVGKKYFSIHRCDEGFDYSFYDLTYHLLDGGVLANPTLSIKAASEEILMDAGLSDETIKGVSFEDLEDRVQKAATITPDPEIPVVETKPEAVSAPKTEEMSIEVAKAISADCGNYSGMTLGDIYETAPKNLVFLLRNSKDENVRCAAKVIVCSDPELSEKFAV